MADRSILAAAEWEPTLREAPRQSLVSRSLTGPGKTRRIRAAREEG
jgi:hypothetical protein